LPRADTKLSAAAPGDPALALNNRRNFYRILHVQPEAPLEVIKASYRSLMSKLKAHPDLGGDHEAAVLINQAYAVLSNPEKRRQYDAALRVTTGPATSARPAHAESPLRPRRASTYTETRTGPRHGSTYTEPRPAPRPVYTQCPFCGTGITGPRRPESRCSSCGSPLALTLAGSGANMRELFGRRAAPRIRKAAELKLYPAWPHEGHAAQLRDVSTTGVSLLSRYRPQVAQVLKLDGGLLSGIAQVVSVRLGAQGTVSIHATLLTAELRARAGAFVSVKA